jgi:hypothetical protein
MLQGSQPQSAKHVKQLPKLMPMALVLFALNAPAVTRYVDLNSPNQTPPYTS